MLPASVRIFVCTVPQDMRRSFDGLALATRQLVGQDPQSGALFVFVNKRSNRAKVLWIERHGYCLLVRALATLLAGGARAESLTRERRRDDEESVRRTAS
jgi:transposase